MELPIKLSADRRTRQVGNFTSPKLGSVQGPLTPPPENRDGAGHLASRVTLDRLIPAQAILVGASPDRTALPAQGRGGPRSERVAPPRPTNLVDAEPALPGGIKLNSPRGSALNNRHSGSDF